MKRKQSKPEVIVGIFGIIAFAIIVYMTREVSDSSVMKGQGRSYTALFTTVTGLIPKSPVEVAGIQVGHVEAIDLADGKARLTLVLNPDVQVFDDAKVIIRSRGILGDQFIALNPGTFGRPQLKEGESIGLGEAGGELSGLMDTMQDASENIREMTATINELIQRQNEKGTFDNILNNLDELTDRLNNLVATNGKSLEHILGNIDQLTSDLSDRNVGQRIGNSSEQLEETIASLNRIISKVERGEGTVGRLLNDETTINRVDDALKGVQKLTSGLNRLKTVLRYRGEYLMDSKDMQNLISLTIKPSPDKYFRFEIIDAPFGDTTVTNTSVESPPGTVVSTTQTISTDDKVLFTFEMAKRFYDLTFRFGLMRNDGGIGLDYSLFDDMLVFSTEAFNFSRFNNNYHVRSYATLNLWSHLLVTGGVDDIFNDNGGIDPFVGMGVFFDDDDIKSLFGLISFSSL